MREWFRGLTNNNIYRRVLHIKYQSSESAQLIYIGGLSTKYIIGVGPLLISEGCPYLKTNTFVLKIMFLISGLGKCEGVGEDSGYELIM